MNLRVLSLASALSLLPAALASAQTPTPPPSGGGSPATHEKGAYEVGALAEGATADPVLKFMYDKNQSVNPTTIGGYVMKHNPNGARLMLDVTYTTTSPKDGDWLGKGKDPSAMEWTEFRNFKLYTVDLVVGHEFGNPDAVFGFFAGGGIGVAYRSGTITSFDDPNGTLGAGSTAISAPKDKLKGTPPVIPTITIRLGPTVNFGNVASLMIDGGLDNGIFVGAQFGLRL